MAILSKSAIFAPETLTFNSSKMKIVRIFLASSHELTPERDRLFDLVTKLNSTFKQRDITIELVRWEELDSSLSRRPKQDEYNDELRQCDISLALFWKIYGPNTVEEVDVAYEQLFNGLKPEKIYVYFKTASDAEISTELKEYKDHFQQRYNDNFIDRFDNEYDLVAKFFLDLERYFSEQLGKNFVIVQQGTVYIGDEEVVKLSEIPFVIKNESYQQRQKELKELNTKITEMQGELGNKQKQVADLEERLKDSSSNDGYIIAYHYAKNDLDKFIEELQIKIDKRTNLEKEFEEQQQFIFDVARKITEYRGHKSTERIKRAIDAFDNGDVEKADFILDEAKQDAEDILVDVRTGKKAGVQLIKELTLAASIKKANGAIDLEKRKQETLQIYEKADELAKECDYDKKEYIDLLFDYGKFLSYYAFFDKAMEVYERLVKSSEETFGKKNYITATTYNNIGLVYKTKGEYDKALEYYLKDLAISEKVLGLEHPDTATTYNNIGLVYQSKGECDKSLEYYLKSVAIFEKVLGLEHPSTATTYNNIGLVYQSKGEYDKALEYYLKSVAIKEKVLGLEHPDTATTYNNIGGVYKSKGEYDKSLEYYLKSVAIFEKVLGKNHPNTITLYINIAGVYIEKHDLDIAVEWYFKSKN